MLRKIIADRKIEYSSYTLVYAAAVLAAKAHLDYVTAVLLMAEAMFFVLYGIFRKDKKILWICGGLFYAGMGRRRRHRMPEAQQAAE